MSLADRIPSDQRTLGNSQVFNVFWIAGLAFAGSILSLLLLQRLGLPLGYVVGVALALLILTIGALVWVSRTMTSETFFFTNRRLQSGPVGIGGATDWVSGCFLVLFFTAALPAKLILAPALMFGILLQVALFSGPFHRSGVLTLPGFVAWRGNSQTGGYAALLTVIAMLLLVIAAEWQIARDILLVIGKLDPQMTNLLLTLLVIIPSLGGGFLGVVLVNGVLAVWMTTAILTPAVVTGFFAAILESGLTLDRDGATLEALRLPRSQFVEMPAEFLHAPYILVAFVVIAAGFSVLPHAWSRLSLNHRPLTSSESLGWAALLSFIMISALPLSLGLIGATPSSAKLAILLKSQPVLFILPYLALFFAAFNVVSVAVFTLSASIVRALRRYRNLNPGEQSVFSTRLFIVIVALTVNFAPLNMLPDPGSLFLIAISLGAASLFLPLIASIWFSMVPYAAVSIAILSGAIVFAAAFYPTGFPGLAHPLVAGAAGMAATAVILVLGLLWRLAAGSNRHEPDRDRLRVPERGA